jgi:mRNA interferase HigB
MEVVGLEVLAVFKAAHTDASSQIDAWLQEVVSARWENPNQLKAQFRAASLVGRGRVVFNIRGNRYRLLVAVAYGVGVVRVLAAGTHEEYDSWDLTE